MKKEVYRNREDFAREYVDGVKECNEVPTWDLLHTAVLYGMECAVSHSDELHKADSFSIEERNLGAKVGDVVRILESGISTIQSGFYISDEHRITAIDWTGHVEFDDGKAVMFRPKVAKVASKTIGYDLQSVTAIRQVQGCTPGVVVVYERDTENAND